METTQYNNIIDNMVEIKSQYTKITLPILYEIGKYLSIKNSSSKKSLQVIGCKKNLCIRGKFVSKIILRPHESIGFVYEKVKLVGGKTYKKAFYVV